MHLLKTVLCWISLQYVSYPADFYLVTMIATRYHSSLEMEGRKSGISVRNRSTENICQWVNESIRFSFDICIASVRIQWELPSDKNNLIIYKKGERVGTGHYMASCHEQAKKGLYVNTIEVYFRPNSIAAFFSKMIALIFEDRSN